MASDGGGRFIPAGIVGLHTLSILLASLVEHDRITEDNHIRRREHAEKEHYRIHNSNTWVQYIILDRGVLTPSPCE